MPKIKFGVFIDPIYLPQTYESIRIMVLDSERLGYDSVWVSDHLMKEKEPILECFTVLSALSSITRKLRLGSMVFCNSYRTPSMLAKMTATLDVASKGRLEFGIGAGWNREEYYAYGYSFPKPSVRILQMKEGIEIIKKLWTEEKTTYQGKYFNIKDAFCEPKPIQKPHPPITIGGSGEKLMLRVVAEYADRSNWGFCSIETFKRKLKVLKKHCSIVNRNYERIEKSLSSRVMISESKAEIEDLLKKLFLLRNPSVSFKEWVKNLKESSIIGTSSDCLEKIKEYVDLEVTYFILNFLDSPSMESMKLFSEEVVNQF